MPLPLLCALLLGSLSPQDTPPVPKAHALTELEIRINNHLASLQDTPATLCQFMDTLTEEQRAPHVDIWIQSLAACKQWTKVRQVAGAHRNAPKIPLGLYEQRSMRLAQAHLALGEPRDAVRIYLEMGARGLTRHHEPALAYAQNTEDWAYLQTVADQVLARVPEQPSALQWKAQSLVMLGKMAEAEPFLARAVVHKPKEASLWANLAAARQTRGASAEALEAADKAIAVDALCMPAHRNRAAALMGLNRHEEARTALTQTLLVAKDPAQRADLEDLLARTDRYLAWQEKQAAAKAAAPARKAKR